MRNGYASPNSRPGKSAGPKRRRRQGALICFAILLLLLLLWLPTFSGRLALFLLGLARPEGWPNPQGLLSGAPRVRRIEYPSGSGRRMVADIYSPGGTSRGAADRRPGILLYTPASRAGLDNLGVRRTADGFARLGYVVMVPFPYGEQIPHVSPGDIADARASLVQFLRLPGVDPSRRIGAGLSYGSGPLLLAAAEPPLSGRLSRFLVLGGYADLREVLRFATTGAYGYHSQRSSLQGRQEPSPYVRQMLGQTLAAWAAPADRQLLAAMVEGRESALPRGLSPAGRRTAELVLNRDPHRFDPLYAELPISIRLKLEALTVSPALMGITAPVYILHPRNDRFVPASEALRLWDALPVSARGAIVIPPALPHGLSLREEWRHLESLRSVWQVYRLAGRALYSTPSG